MRNRNNAYFMAEIASSMNSSPSSVIALSFATRMATSLPFHSPDIIYCGKIQTRSMHCTRSGKCLRVQVLKTHITVWFSEQLISQTRVHGLTTPTVLPSTHENTAFLDNNPQLQENWWMACALPWTYWLICAYCMLKTLVYGRLDYVCVQQYDQLTQLSVSSSLNGCGTDSS